MTLQSSPPISLEDIGLEFEDTAPYALLDYYAGGAYVPSGTTGDGGPIPTSGTISLQDFLGASNIVVNLVNKTSTTDKEIGTATAGFSFKSNGDIENLGLSGTDSTWINKTGLGSSYEVKAILSSGDGPSGPAFNVWHILSSTRTWTLSNNSGGTNDCVLSVSIRDTATDTVQDTANFTISVDNTEPL